MSIRMCIAAVGAVAPSALAQQSNISPQDKWCWGENVGWMNWRDAGDPAGSQGARVHATFLSGMVWSENTGWVNLGDGTPGLGDAYANADGSDAGVNIDPDGTLRGLAWGENIGWINFDTAGALAQYNQEARFDPGARRFRGYAWAENVGWISLDDEEHFVATICPADWNNDGEVNTLDFLAYLGDWAAQSQAADLTGDHRVDTLDFLAYLNIWAAGC